MVTVRKGRLLAAATATLAIGATAIAAAGSSASPDASSPASSAAAINAAPIASTTTLRPASPVNAAKFREAGQYSVFAGRALSDAPTRLAQAAQAPASSVRRIPVPAGIVSQVWAAQGPEGPCVLVQNPNGTGGVACAAAQSAEPPAISLSGPDTGLKGTLIAGVVPDGVEAVTETLSDGSKVKINVTGNGYVASVPTEATKLGGIVVPGFDSEAN